MEVLIKFNTNDKTMAVTVDGSVVENVSDVAVYQHYDDKDSYELSMTTRVKDELNNCLKMTRLLAHDTSEAKKAVASGLATESKTSGFVEVPEQTRAQKDIAKFFGE